jgi:hypothetical protein
MLLQYTKNKGFCDDLDEGKLSFPIILSNMGVSYIFTLKVLVVIADLEVSSKQGRKLTYIKVRLMRSEATKNRYFKPDHTVYSDPG